MSPRASGALFLLLLLAGVQALVLGALRAFYDEEPVRALPFIIGGPACLLAAMLIQDRWRR